jgi:LacI family transcriptional regulator
LDAKSPRKETSPTTKERSTLPPKSVSLKHVAAHVGLSIAAVSRVLAHAPAAQSIPEPTRRRIVDAARLLNYQPNALARSLRSQRSLTLGVMLPEISEGYATLVLSGIEERLIAEGYFYLLASHHHRPDLIESYQRLLLARAIEGLLVIDTPLDHHPAVPTIAISGRHTHDGVSSVVLNHELAGRLALTHLRTLGHRRIAFLKGQPFSSDTHSRWLGIRHAAKALDIEIDPHLVAALEGDQPDHTPGYLATRALLAAGRPFTALFAFNDIAAIGAILALREADLRVPEDVSVIGFDDIQGAAFQHPALTTIRQPLRQMGALAAQAILRELKSPGAPIQRIVVDPELIVRDSTGPAPQPASRTKK